MPRTYPRNLTEAARCLSTDIIHDPIHACGSRAGPAEAAERRGSRQGSLAGCCQPRSLALTLALLPVVHAGAASTTGIGLSEISEPSLRLRRPASRQPSGLLPSQFQRRLPLSDLYHRRKELIKCLANPPGPSLPASRPLRSRAVPTGSSAHSPAAAQPLPAAAHPRPAAAHSLTLQDRAVDPTPGPGRPRAEQPARPAACPRRVSR